MSTLLASGLLTGETLFRNPRKNFLGNVRIILFFRVAATSRGYHRLNFTFSSTIFESKHMKPTLILLVALIGGLSAPLALSSNAQTLTVAQDNAYNRLWEKKKYDTIDLKEIVRVFNFNLDSLSAIELSNRIADYGSSELLDKLDKITNGSKEGLKLYKALAMSNEIDEQYAAFARGETAKLTPESKALFVSLLPETVTAIKNAVSTNNLPALHHIQELLDFQLNGLSGKPTKADTAKTASPH